MRVKHTHEHFWSSAENKQLMATYYYRAETEPKDTQFTDQNIFVINTEMTYWISKHWNRMSKPAKVGAHPQKSPGDQG